MHGRCYFDLVSGYRRVTMAGVAAGASCLGEERLCQSSRFVEAWRGGRKRRCRW